MLSIVVYNQLHGVFMLKRSILILLQWQSILNLVGAETAIKPVSKLLFGQRLW